MRVRHRARRLTALVAIAAALLSATAASAAEVTAINPNDTPAQIIAKAAGVTPSPNQLAWQRLEQTAFIHFGLNTYDGTEQGTGTTSPNLFQPTGLNTDQWVSTLKNAGFKEVILTAKHADGFLLFPSKYSTYGVASSSWDNGQGDILKSFTDSMHKYGLKVGIYLGPADLHEAQPGGTFANGSAAKPVTIPSDLSEVANGTTFSFNSDDYNTYYENTLYETLTRYGEIDEVWWDGANPTNRTQNYDFPNWISMVRKLQPNAVIFNDQGPDARWVGNEAGAARQSEWDVMPFDGDPATAADTRLPVPGGNGATDIGGDDILSQRNADGTSAWNGLRWTPAECDTTLSANHNWYWHPGDTLQSQSALTDLYYSSVGQNCNLLLDVPPNQQGVFDSSAVTALTNFHNAISATFGTNLAAGAAAANDAGTTNTAGHTPDLALDGNPDTSWQPTATTGALVYTLPQATTFNVISAQEDLNVGQRVESYAVDAWQNGAWTQIATDTTIGQKKLTRLTTPVTTTKVRLRVTGARANPAVAEFGLYRSAAGPITGYQGLCMDVRGASSADRTPVQLYGCNGTGAQQWTEPGDGTVTALGKCLDVTAGGTANGTLVQLYSCNGTGAQQWQPRPDGTMLNPQSGRCLDDTAFGGAGTQLEIWDCNGGTNQKWTQP
ncbi:alpha-L-fucosidase [Catenulispora sp. MAP12-49]|uniref:alpha-L-fucosidase n=1 Tax=Catenulispora sp. MAP12-49 TaxID=3156302 RepID=UPI00351592B0